MYRRSGQPRHIVDLLFGITLFGVFAVTALTAVVTGARVYANTTAQMDGNFAARTGMSYLFEKIRQADASGAIAVGSVEGSPALALSQDYEGAAYVTWIYQDEGSLKEALVRQDASVKRTDGQAVVPADAMSIRWREERVLDIVITVGGADWQLFVSPRSGAKFGGE